MVGFVISSFKAFLSFLVRLSVVFCLCFCSSTISSLILWRNVSSLPLSVSLSWLNLECFFRFEWISLGIVYWCFVM